MELADVWPLFGLELHTPRLMMRPVRDEDIPGLVDAALAGIHDPAVMPFSSPWTDQEPHVLARELARWVWTSRSGMTPGGWTVLLSVLQDGKPIGVQDVAARQFSTLRTVRTGSWLTQRVQGQGLGTEMRAGVLQFAFDHLAADRALSGAAVWNASSLGVSRALGYVENGVEYVTARPGEADIMQRLVLTRDDFARPDWTLTVHGAEAVRPTLVGG